MRGPIAPDAVWPVFNAAPGIAKRQALSTQLPTGLTVLDELFPLVRGQRLAVLGDKWVKPPWLWRCCSTRETDITVVYVMVAKRRRGLSMLC